MMEKAKHIRILEGMSFWRENEYLVQKGRIVGAKPLCSLEGVGSSARVEGLTLEEWYPLGKNTHKIWPSIYFLNSVL